MAGGVGLEVELVFFQAAAPMAVAIASGDIDYGVTAISGGLINLANKGAIKIIGGALVEEKGVDGQKILVSNAAFDAGVTSPAKLAGRSFGITQTGSSFHYMIAQIAAKVYFIAVVDANVLTAEDTGDLFYLYHLGFERPILERFVAGAYFYHRSNHQLAEAGEVVNSINVLEAGIESRDWHRPGRRSPTGRWGQLDARARVGLLLDSTFGKETAWHLRAGLRWSAPVVASVLQPFLLAEVETGDVERRLYAVGLSPSRGLDLQLESRYDEQYFSADDRLWLINARYGF